MKLLIYRFDSAKGRPQTALVIASDQPSAQRDEFLEDALLGLPNPIRVAEVDLGDFQPGKFGVEVFHAYKP